VSGILPADNSDRHDTIATSSEASVWRCPIRRDPSGSHVARRVRGEGGETVMALLAKNLRPRDICTREAFENAATIVAATVVRPMPRCICRPMGE